MGRERVAQRVRADLAGRDRPRVAARGHGRPRLLAREPPAAVAEEQRAATHRFDVVQREQTRRGAVDPRGQPVDRHVADGHEPLLVALADDPHEPAVEREVLAVEPDRLADPQPRRVEQLEERPVRAAPRSDAASSSRSTSSTSSVSGRRRVWRGRSRWAATSTSISPSP